MWSYVVPLVWLDTAPIVSPVGHCAGAHHCPCSVEFVGSASTCHLGGLSVAHPSVWSSRSPPPKSAYPSRFAPGTRMNPIQPSQLLSWHQWDSPRTSRIRPGFACTTCWISSTNCEPWGVYEWWCTYSSNSERCLISKSTIESSWKKCFVFSYRDGNSRCIRYWISLNLGNVLIKWTSYSWPSWCPTGNQLTAIPHWNYSVWNRQSTVFAMVLRSWHTWDSPLFGIDSSSNSITQKLSKYILNALHLHFAAVRFISQISTDCELAWSYGHGC